MSVKERRCFGCGGGIAECMGFVKAGDMLDERGEFIWDYSYRAVPRELCSACVENWQWTAEGTLIPREFTEEEMAMRLTRRSSVGMRRCRTWRGC